MDIRSFRAKHGLTLEAFATLVGASVPTVSRWERAIATPTLRNIERIARVTDGEVTVEDFLSANRVTAPTNRFGAYPRKSRKGRDVPRPLGFLARGSG